MSGANTTPASMAYPPEKPCGGDQPQAHSYPGRSRPSAEKVVEASHDAAALKEGKSNSMGVSADGSTKGEPTSMEEVGRMTTQPPAPKFAYTYPGV
jgi:hypothetical protein